MKQFIEYVKSEYLEDFVVYTQLAELYAYAYIPNWIFA